MKSVLVTGAAGFIGYHVSERLTEQGDKVVGIDSLNDYYDVNLKIARFQRLEKKRNFTFRKLDLADRNGIEKLFAEETFDVVVNMAAQAGVRYSLTNPHVYTSSNIEGFLNVLEGCRNNSVKHLVFASSSSVYGANTKTPFSVHDKADHPVSFYGATKRANELMAHSYSSLYGLPCTGLRLFTVYGPWGRPDMAIFLFARAIMSGRSIDVFNSGKMERDFTYIDDVVEGVVRVMERIPQPNPEWSGENPDSASSNAPYKLYNVGNNNPVGLMKLIEVLEQCLGRKAQKNLLPLQPGDIPVTCAEVDDLVKDVGFRPSTSIEEGVQKFAEWYLSYYRHAQIKSLERPNSEQS
jgi:UDP-glucuronate 4-epimerase